MPRTAAVQNVRKPREADREAVDEVVDEVVDPNAARVSWGEDERSLLLAAGRSPKEQRSGLVIWRTPGGSWYREEVAVLPLARDRGPP